MISWCIILTIHLQFKLYATHPRVYAQILQVLKGDLTKSCKIISGGVNAFNRYARGKLAIPRPLVITPARSASLLVNGTWGSCRHRELLFLIPRLSH